MSTQINDTDVKTNGKAHDWLRFWEWVSKGAIGIILFFLINVWKDISDLKKQHTDFMVEMQKSVTRIDDLDVHVKQLERRMREHDETLLMLYRERITTPGYVFPRTD